MATQKVETEKVTIATDLELSIIEGLEEARGLDARASGVPTHGQPDQDHPRTTPEIKILRHGDPTPEVGAAPWRVTRPDPVDAEG